MKSDLQRYRFLGDQLHSPSHPRLLVLTGARQTGKTTLVRSRFPDLRYINLDSAEDREVIRQVRTSDWADVVGEAVLDEAQKEPSLFDKVKHAFDAGTIQRSILLGSSQILMLQRIRETLAGRTFVYELWPLLASELVQPAESAPSLPLMHRLFTDSGSADDLLTGEPPLRLGEEAARASAAIEHLLEWGGMPALLPLNDRERRKWLRSYDTTYLERDLGDLVRLNDLMPFRRFQRLCALRSGQLLSFSELARDAGLSITTSRRYIEYLRVSYQAFVLPPWSTNLTSTVVKTPKVYWIDPGLWRHLTRYHGEATGDLFETAVVSELFKWIKTHDLDAELSFYRTRSRMEVDLLISTPTGVWGVEIKSASRLSGTAWRGLRSLAESLGKDWRGGIVIYRGTALERQGENLWKVPVDRLLV